MGEAAASASGAAREAVAAERCELGRLLAGNICLAALIATAGAGKNLVDQVAARAAIAEITATD